LGKKVLQPIDMASASHARDRRSEQRQHGWISFCDDGVAAARDSPKHPSSRGIISKVIDGAARKMVPAKERRWHPMDIDALNVLVREQSICRRVIALLAGY